MDAKERWKEDKALAQERQIEREKQRVDFVIGHNADPADFPGETILSLRKDRPYLLLQCPTGVRVVEYRGIPRFKWVLVWYGDDVGRGRFITDILNQAWQLGAEWAHRQASCGDSGRPG